MKQMTLDASEFILIPDSTSKWHVTRLSSLTTAPASSGASGRRVPVRRRANSKRPCGNSAGIGQTVYLAGRTDTGTHASGQVAAFDLDWLHGLEKLQDALNANLPRIWPSGKSK